MSERSDERYRVYLQAQLQGVDLTVNNISAHGLQLSCPDFLLHSIKDTLDKGNFDLDIKLPIGGSPCTANAKLVYLSEIEDEHLLGLEYESLDDDQQSKLSQYLQSLADRNAPTVN